MIKQTKFYGKLYRSKEVFEVEVKLTLLDREYDAFQMINDVKIYILMSKVHTGSGASNKVGDVLQKAHDLQNMYFLALHMC